VLSHFEKKLILSLVLLVLTLLLGSSGYSLIEGWSFFDSVYMTVITLSTVGFQEIRPLSDIGKAFTIGLIFLGLGVVAYIVNNGMRAIFEGEFRETFGRRKLEKAIKSLKDHYVVCGYGRMGKVICKEFKAKKVPFVVVEKEYQELHSDDDSIIIYGDATKDELLIQAGIEKAKGLISVLDTDTQNLYVVLSAKGLNPNLYIVARSGEEGAEHKLKRAGADKVVSPYHIGGLRIAHTVLKPTVVDLLEFATKTGNVELEIEEVTVEEGSPLADKTIKDADIRKNHGVIIVAIRRKSGEIIFTPPANTHIRAGDKVAAIGETEQFNRLEELAKGKRNLDISET
jgi:voltage-gated potassium channel